MIESDKVRKCPVAIRSRGAIFCSQWTLGMYFFYTAGVLGQAIIVKKEPQEKSFLKVDRK